ncbi:MAG: M20 aminoacylase family protein [Pseudomonadota bacterium]
MPILNRAAELQDEVKGWRRHLHQHPELMFDVHETARFVEEKLRAFGVDELVTGIGRTGVVGVIKGNRGPGETLGLRADMDALPIKEATGAAHASKVDGKMHACGHDGHTAMLLGAAKYLAETRNFPGTIVVIFQPAEEGGGGGREMVQDGLMERFGVDRVYGMHNMPQVPVGEFTIRAGAFFAATDQFMISVRGKGGHAAMPHQGVDPIVIGSQIVQGLQTIASRSVDPIGSVVVSVTQFQAGEAYNVIPETAKIAGTIRTLDADIRLQAEEKLKSVTKGIAEAFGASVDIQFWRGYPVTVNDANETETAVTNATAIVGSDNVGRDIEPFMGGEDFAYMLEERPGSMILIGNGDSAGLHHPAYDFNDDMIPYGISYWASIAENNRAT